MTLRRWPFGRDQAWRSWGQAPPQPLSLARWGRREGITIVQCVAGPRTGTLGYCLARAMGRACCSTITNDRSHATGLPRWLEAAVGRRAERAVAVSRFVAAPLPRTGRPPSVWTWSATAQPDPLYPHD